MTEDNYTKLQALKEELNVLSGIIKSLNRKKSYAILRLEIHEPHATEDRMCRWYPDIETSILEKYIPTIQKDIEKRASELKEIFELL